MKCEKCGAEILEGTLCENCKSVSLVNENAVSEVPQAYDPVADLMNEPVNGTVNLEKNELENSIPMGDNVGVPEMPTNENVVSVMPQVENNQVPVVEVAPADVNTTPVENSTEVNPAVQNTDNPAAIQPEKKKMSTGAIIAIIVGVVVLLAGGIFLYLRYLNVSKMFDTAKASVFVTEVQSYMDMAKTKFMSEAMKPGNQGKSLEFSSEGTTLDAEDNTKTYKINLDRNMNITGIIIYDETFCYSDLDEFGQDLDKTMVNVEDVLPHVKEDNLTDGCHGVKNN